jgi:ribosomal protein L21
VTGPVGHVPPRVSDQVETRVDAAHVGAEVVAGDRVSSDVVVSLQARRVEVCRQCERLRVSARIGHRRTR